MPDSLKDVTSTVVCYDLRKVAKRSAGDSMNTFASKGLTNRAADAPVFLNHDEPKCASILIRNVLVLGASAKAALGSNYSMESCYSVEGLPCSKEHLN